MPHAFPGLEHMRWRNPLAVIWRLYCRAIWLKDLPLLAAMGKTLAVTWQGDDARQHDHSLGNFDVSIAKALGEDYYPSGSDEWKRRTIAAFARHVPLHYALNPDLLHVLPERACFLPYASFDPASVVPALPAIEAPSRLVMAHAPSHRGAKGTAHIMAAAERLKAEGVAFHLELIEGLPRSQAMARYRECDVVIDQLLAGWYGGLGVEAMALGKPVVAHIRRSDLGPVDAAFIADLPVIDADPDSIYVVMKQLIAMPRPELHALGRRSRAFAERWHDPLTIARQTLAAYQSSRKEPST